MVQTNKILTVSYGTFSCTLEGFDESFETMKAIAEYFRDLAADDRYFGAEPPTPDVEMLARIAEKEISRRVEARFENDGIVLRPSLAAATDADIADEPGAGAETAERSLAPSDTSGEPTPAEARDTESRDAESQDTEDQDAEAQDAELETASEALSDMGIDATEDAAEADNVAEADVAADTPEDVAQEDTGAEEISDPLAAARDEMPADTAEQAQDDTPAAAPVQVYAPGEDPVIKAASPGKVPESIAEKLARIRAVVSSAATAPKAGPQDVPEQPVEEAVVAAPAEQTVAEDTSDDALVGSIMSTLASGAAEDTLAPAEAPLVVATDSPEVETALADMAQGYTVQQVETPVIDRVAESIASAISEEDAAEFAEAQPADTAEDMAQDRHSDRVFTDDFADMAGAGDLDEATRGFNLSADLTEDRVEDELIEEDLIEDLAEEDRAEDDRAEEVAEEADLDDRTEAAEAAEETPETLSDDQGEMADAAELMDAPEQTETPVETSDPADSPEAAERTDADNDAPQAEDGPIAPRRVAPRRAVRVVKVKRRAAQVDAPAAPLMADTGDSTLAPEDEADLMRELAELEADFTPAEQAAETAEAEATPEAPLTEETAQDISDVVDDTARTIRAMARRDRRDSFAEDEGDVSRLLAETDEQLQEPEGRSRRNAIAHLRAAVAATRADRGSDARPAGSQDRGEAYREDLAQAVRPRRSTVETPQERPRIAPLKLVAEQRVDLPEDAAEAPSAETAAQAVRPRRVSMPVDRDEGPEAGGFAAFAEEVGASRLPELLEAAAAYMSFVEGRDQFSRPQLMTKVRQIERGDSSREDRLRSFGQLLRDGKIEKVQGGRFTASDSIRFRPDDRAVG
ncbi:MAG: hypothetical protein EP318_17405 [Rhodobacteraceae bacterium]|nr:MAG: hypothetical protein EP318_17405 [Paracoccaceae bacterium]